MRNFSTTMSSKSSDRLFSMKKYTCTDKIGKIKVPSKLLMIQKVLEKFWKYIGSKRKKGKNVAIFCNGK